MEDGVDIMTIFRSRVRLNSTDGSSEAVVEQRAIRYPCWFETHQQTSCSSCSTVLNGEQKHSSQHSAPTDLMTVHAQKDWVNAFTTRFALANRTSLLARAFATIKQEDKQTVDT